MRRSLRSLALFMALAAAACLPPVDAADLVLRNGTIVTVDPVQPEAEAIAVVGDRIVAVGRFTALERYVGDQTQVIDLDGALAIP